MLTASRAARYSRTDGPGDRQFFFYLGGHAGSGALVRLNLDGLGAAVHPGGHSPGCDLHRLAVPGPGSAAWALGFGPDGVGEGISLAIPGAFRGIEVSFRAGVLLLGPFDPPLRGRARSL